jgi:CRISPR/Cas system-associated exonuclease Cas4 (RecB family)
MIISILSYKKLWDFLIQKTFLNNETCPIKIVLHFIELEETVELMIEKSEMKEIENYWMNLITEIESQTEFKKNKKSCTYCDFHSHCKPNTISMEEFNV